MFALFCYHFLLGVKVSVAYRQLEMNASLAHSFEKKDVERDELGEEMVAGIGIKIVL